MLSDWPDRQCLQTKRSKFIGEHFHATTSIVTLISLTTQTCVIPCNITRIVKRGINTLINLIYLLCLVDKLHYYIISLISIILFRPIKYS